MRVTVRRCTIALAGLALVALTVAALRPSPSSGLNATQRENLRPGSVAWRSPQLNDAIRRAQRATGDPDAPAAAAEFPLPDPIPESGEPLVDLKVSATEDAQASATPVLPYGRFIAGYTSKDSIDQGQPIELHISAIRSPYDVEIYRMGWYGGARSSLIWSKTGNTSVFYAAPALDANGTAAATWPVALSIPTNSSWTSGVYIAKLMAGGDTEYATWVIRNDRSTAAILYQVATTTWQAYEAWGGASLYQPSTAPAVPAVKVSYDRPYYGGDGTGLLFSGEAQTVAFLEREGYDVTYATSTDTHANANLMQGHRLFMTAFHDEYWSKEMRDHLDSWIAAGKNVAFLSANNMYWQIRFETSAAGVANRVIVCYKSTADPIMATNPSLATLLWRSGTLNRPESLVTGNQYDDSRSDFGSKPWIVANDSNWFYSGTGLRNGDALPGVVGIEWDLIPGAVAPAGVTELSNSPMAPSGLRQQATLKTASSGAEVFDAGSLKYALFLDNYTADPTTAAKVQQITRNLVSRLSGAPTTPPPTTLTPTTTTAAPTTTTAAPTTTTAPPTTTAVVVPRTAAPAAAPQVTVARKVVEGAPGLPTPSLGRS